MTLFVPRTRSNEAEWTRQSSGVINQLVNRQVAVDTFTTTQTLDYNHDVALCDATSAAFTVTLPKAAMHPRRELIVKKVDASANAITVEGDGAETIDGAANVSLDAQWDFVSVISDGTSWSIIASTATAGGGGGTTDELLTFDNSGSGAASGATFDGSAPVTVSRNTIGAAASSHSHAQSDLTGLTTADSPQFAGVNVGHASDTTITRASAGVIAVEGSNVVTVAGGTFTGDISVPDEAYDATNWSGSAEVPTKNAIRDKIESMGSSAWAHIQTLSPSAVASIDSEAWAGGSYKQLAFVLYLEVATDATGIGIQFKLNGSYQTGANYLMGAMHSSSSGSNSTEDDTAATQGHLVEANATWGAGNQPFEFLDGELKINFPFNTARAKRWKFNGSHGATSGAHVDITASGIYTGTDNSAALQGVRFLGVGTNITGTIEVYGLS